MEWTAEAVLALAPDDASAKAARGLVSPAKWPTLGADDAAVWGECQGSGSKPYQTQVDLQGPAFRCSCPSRKFPCKHGLALLLMRVAEPARFAGAVQPSWVSEWLKGRAEKAEKKEQKAQAAPAAPADPAAAAKRTAQRWERSAAAAEELQHWLRDQVARGLGALGEAQRKEWQTMAARLVDMQVPGLAARVQDAAHAIGQGSDWPERLLHILGLLQLVCDGLRRHTTLPTALRDELRTVIGWPLDKAEVLAEGEPVRDRWCVIGQVTEERADRLTERRVWLQGERSGRRALLLDHAHAGKGFEQSWLTGAGHEVELVFYPGTAKLRALAAALHDGPVAAQPLTATLDDEWQRVAQRAAAAPWTPLHPMLVADAVLLREAGQWTLRTPNENLALSINDADAWQLAAHSGGRAAHVMGEWSGSALRPLSAWTPDGLWQRGGLA
jgi:hypothetical protein